MELPVSLINDLDLAPRDRTVALLMRHSARHPILDPSDPYVAKLTEQGVRMAEELGVVLGQHFNGGRLLSSPVGRCIDTAAAIARGAGWPALVQTDERLSHPFIEPAWDKFLRGDVNGVLPGPVLSALDLILDPSCTEPVLDVMVTHDTHVGTLAGCLFKVPVTEKYWSGFLEGILLWRSGTQIRARWRGLEWRLGADYHLLTS
jgi:hypothetical protein